MKLRQAELGKEYTIRHIDTGDRELNEFLLTLGCYAGGTITVIAHRRSGSTVSIKDARYSIDIPLAEAILV